MMSSSTPPFLAAIRPHMEQVERHLRETLARVEEPLGSKLRHSLGEGKRLRPALVILSGELFVPCGRPFHRLAVAVELLHTATLIHDDLVDGSSWRRGREALHTLWPTGPTVLAGDYLLALSAALIAELGRPRILEVFASALCTMCAGEIEQTVTREKSRRREDYYRGIEAKTASFCAAITEMAGILAAASESQITALRCFGWELGVAFQIADDVLDFVGNEAELGKPAGSDLRQGLLTLPTLHYLEGADDATPVNAVLSGERDAEHLRAAIEAVRASGAIGRALTEARAHARQGQEALAGLPDNAARGMLWALTEYVVERRH